MAKQQTSCPCGGTFDGTPSGRTRHNASNQHRTYAAGIELAAQQAANSPAFAGTPEGQEVLEIAAKQAKQARVKADKPVKAPATPKNVAPENADLADLFKAVKKARADFIWARNKFAEGKLAEAKVNKRIEQYAAAQAAYREKGGEWID